MKLLAAIAAASVFAAPTAWAQAYPSKPIQIVAASAPGAGVDLLTRTVQDRFAALLGQPVVVENRAGAAGFIGSDYVKKAPADGYTLLTVGDDIALWRALGIHQGIDVLTDFAPVALLGTVDFFLVVSGEAMKASTPQELVALAKQKPNAFSFASPGTGAPHHLAMELFKSETGTELVHVPYKGMGPAMPDFVAGRVQVVMTGYPAIAPYAATGKIRILGAAWPERSKLQPNIPTLKEQGIANVETQGYFPMLAPAGTPAAVVTRLNTELNKVLATPQIREDLARRAVTAAGGTPEQLSQKLRTEIDKWTAVVKRAGVKAEE